MNLPLEVEGFLDEQKMFDENDPEYSVIPLLMEKFNVSEEVASSYANEYITLLFDDDGQPTHYEEMQDVYGGDDYIEQWEDDSWD